MLPFVSVKMEHMAESKKCQSHKVEQSGHGVFTSMRQSHFVEAGM